jgi:hypothetical protein
MMELWKDGMMGVDDPVNKQNRLTTKCAKGAKGIGILLIL